MPNIDLYPVGFVRVTNQRSWPNKTARNDHGSTSAPVPVRKQPPVASPSLRLFFEDPSAAMIYKSGGFRRKNWNK